MGNYAIARMSKDKADKSYKFIKYKHLYPEYCRWIKSDDKYLKMSPARKRYLFICHKKLLREYNEQVCIYNSEENYFQFIPKWEACRLAQIKW